MPEKMLKNSKNIHLKNLFAYLSDISDSIGSLDLKYL